ncbi:MAG TPA: metalloregulator ArsR/SmtB family transcription factor [Armatimonadota bacterium]|nr:metalloregulator ArsR/SmtB family transcription factor [Armatimonadota bacterium]HOS43082.1 metalloregulator ArsR/SmtB family transcription factor [Armatimonadota bacterium]
MRALRKWEDDRCAIFSSDEHKVARLRGEVGRAEGLGNLFKALSDETRAKIMYCLSREELCVCDVANILGMSVQAVSHHLRLLRVMRLVRARRAGKLVFYALDDDHVARMIEQGLAHLAHGKE